jgi:hypothetical protein
VPQAVGGGSLRGLAGRGAGARGSRSSRPVARALTIRAHGWRSARGPKGLSRGGGALGAKGWAISPVFFRRQCGPAARPPRGRRAGPGAGAGGQGNRLRRAPHGRARDDTSSAKSMGAGGLTGSRGRQGKGRAPRGRHGWCVPGRVAQLGRRVGGTAVTDRVEGPGGMGGWGPQPQHCRLSAAAAAALRQGPRARGPCLQGASRRGEGGCSEGAPGVPQQGTPARHSHIGAGPVRTRARARAPRPGPGMSWATEGAVAAAAAGPCRRAGAGRGAPRAVGHWAWGREATGRRRRRGRPQGA